MKRLRNGLIYFVLAVAMIIFFAPKRQLYYLAESALEPYGVILSGEFVDDGGFSLSLQGGALYYQDLKIAQLGDVSILPLVVFNVVNVSPFTFSEAMQQFIPGTIDELQVYQSMIDPLHLHLKGTGEFGKVVGSADLLHHKVTMTLTPSAALLDSNAVWLKELKKQPTGEYLYEVAY